MARRSVTLTPLIEVIKKVRKDLGGGVPALRQIRKTKNTVTNPRLLRINACIASQLGGKTFGSLGEVQKAFRAARQGPCKL